MTARAEAPARRTGSALEVLLAFLRLGLTSFGGPIAHLGFFHEAFVVRRRWIGERAYADLVALCQFLPGPASSQVGMAIGLQRAGFAGMLAAWAAFTLPSAVLLVAFGFAVTGLSGVVEGGWIQGLKAAAVAVVAQAVLGMARTLTPDARRVLLAGFLAFSGVLQSGWLQLFGVFSRAGALVFGGGHVVLPLLESQTVPGLVGRSDFLAGYGAAQAVPGPLFTFSASLGTVSTGSPSGVGGAVVALVGIFLPGALLVVGALPFWASLRRARRARRALMGMNAGVVGLLGAALYSPVFTEGVTSVVALCIAVAAFVVLMRWRTPPWAVVIAAGVAGGLLL